MHGHRRQIVWHTAHRIGLDFMFAKDLFAAASEWFVEDGRGFTAGNGGGCQEYFFSGGLTWRKGRNYQRRVSPAPPHPTIYSYMATRIHVRGLSPFRYVHTRGASPRRDDAHHGSARARNYRGCASMMYYR